MTSPPLFSREALLLPCSLLPCRFAPVLRRQDLLPCPVQGEDLGPLTLPPCLLEPIGALSLELQEILQTKYGVREAPELASPTAWKNVALLFEETTALESLRRKRSTKNRLLVHNVKKLAATDATAKNPMQATDATATPTDVLLGFVMRNPTSSHCSQNLQFGNY